MNRKNRHRIINGLKPQKVRGMASKNIVVDFVPETTKNDIQETGFGAHWQSIAVSIDLKREEIFELGRIGPYFRFVSFPIEITEEIKSGERVES